MTSSAQRAAPFRWNQDPTHAGKQLPETPFSCSEIASVIMSAIITNPDKEVLGFEGQLTTFACISHLQNKIAPQGYRAAVCFNSQDAKEKIGNHYCHSNSWHPGQYQIFVIKNRAYKGSA